MPLAGLCTTMLGCSYLATSEGADFRASSAFWADPLSRLAGPLLGFASPDAVYRTWLLPVAMLLFLVPWALLHCTLHPVSGEPLRRRPHQVALFGAWATAVGALTIAVTLHVVPPSHPAVNATFFAVLMPGQLISWLATTAVGISAWRQNRPASAGMLVLAGTLPVAILTQATGHNSMVLTWQLLGWALVASRSATGSR